MESTQDNVIEVKNVSKLFKLPHEKRNSLKSAVVNFYKMKRGYDLQQALKDISFEVKNGEFLGIVGRNGSGKSTLLKLLAGIYSPTDGTITVNGKLTPFIELGVGFSPELTGRENVFLNGSLLGFTRKEMRVMYDDIVDFAELHKFMDQKLKNYSSGMQVRLAFSIATRVQTDILVLDEVLAVGDAAFQRKCFDYFMQLKKIKKTVILVTHDMGAVRQYCDRAFMLNDGKIVKTGTPDNIAQTYQKMFAQEIDEEFKASEFEKGDGERWGTRKVLGSKPKVTVSDESVTIEATFEAFQDIEPPIIGFQIYGPNGANIVETNTERDKVKTKAMKKGDRTSITWSLPNIFNEGRYTMSLEICDQPKVEFYDWQNNAAEFNISREEPSGALVYPKVKTLDYKFQGSTKDK